MFYKQAPPLVLNFNPRSRIQLVMNHTYWTQCRYLQLQQLREFEWQSIWFWSGELLTIFYLISIPLFNKFIVVFKRLIYVFSVSGEFLKCSPEVEGCKFKLRVNHLWRDVNSLMSFSTLHLLNSSISCSLKIFSG